MWNIEIRDLLLQLGEDVEREGLRGTPERVKSTWLELLEGYTLDPREILNTTFEAESTGIQICKNIAFTSMCEHHLLAFWGYTHICYIPQEQVVGLSKLSRLVDCFAKRLQIQERLTEQIADALFAGIEAKGVFVIVDAIHLCCKGRGIRRDRMSFTTTATKGDIDVVLSMQLLGDRGGF